MKHELQIRAGDLPPQDIHQLSPSDIKQLLLDVLQPQHTARSSPDRPRGSGPHLHALPEFLVFVILNCIVCSRVSPFSPR